VLLVLRRTVPEIKAKQVPLLLIQSIGSIVWLTSLLVRVLLLASENCSGKQCVFIDFESHTAKMLLSSANNNYIERKSWESPLHMLCTSLAANRRVCAGFQQIVNKAYTLQGFVVVSIRRRDPTTGLRVQGFGFFSIRRGDPITGFRVQGFGFVSMRRGDPFQDLGFKDLHLCP
jgi:hypothetical protein